jgi:hypothetical protein
MMNCVRKSYGMSTRVSLYLYWVWDFEPEEVERGMKD